MNTNKNNPLEQEFRSSQVYKALTDLKGPVADRIAQGLGKAAESLDQALNSALPPTQQSGQTVQTGQPTQWQRPAGTGNGTAGGADPYSYRYKYPNRGNQPQQPAQQTYPGKMPQGVSPAPAPQMPKMKVVRRGSPMKFYVTALAALFYAWNFPLYEPGHFIAFGVILALVFLGSSALFKGKKEFVPIEPEKPKKKAKDKSKAKEAPQEEKKPQQEESPTGNPEVDKIIRDGNDYLKKLRSANDAIPDETLTEDITRMEKASADIFRFIADHPQKAPEIRKFMNYYLPTTLKLLNSYQRLSRQSAKGENITSTMFNIAGMMHTVADAFEKQLDSLFSDEAMDVSADISVFETLLKQEGFVEETKPQPKTKGQ